MRFLLRAGVVFLMTVALYYAVDLGAWYAHSLFPDRRPNDFATRPAYQDEPEASASLIAEVSLHRPRWNVLPGGDLLEPIEYHSDVFNVDRLPPTNLAYRRTINPATPGKPAITVLLVGASQVYGPLVGDSGTLASALSARLHALDPGHNYVVYNAGMVGADASKLGGRIALELERGLKPDIIVTLDGTIDAMRGLYFADPDQGMALVDTQNGWFLDVVPIHIFQYLRRRAAAARTKADRNGASAPPDPATVARLTRQTGQLYLDQHAAFAAMASKAGARYIAFLEPNPFSPSFTHPGTDIADVTRRTEQSTPGLPAAVRASQPALASAVVELQARGIDAVDLSDVLQDKTKNVYYTIGHYNSLGYRLLAEPMAEAILRAEGIAPAVSP